MPVMTQLEKLLMSSETSMSRKVNDNIIKIWWVNNRVEVTNVTTGKKLGYFRNEGGPHLDENKLNKILSQHNII